MEREIKGRKERTNSESKIELIKNGKRNKEKKEMSKAT
jgi:hypothetical protein